MILVLWSDTHVPPRNLQLKPFQSKNLLQTAKPPESPELQCLQGSKHKHTVLLSNEAVYTTTNVIRFRGYLLSSAYIGVGKVPKVVANGAPNSVVLYLHPALRRVIAPSEPHRVLTLNVVWRTKKRVDEQLANKARIARLP